MVPGNRLVEGGVEPAPNFGESMSKRKALALALLKIFGAWVLFVFATVNTAAQTYAFVMGHAGSVGSGAIVRLLLIALAFGGWDVLRRI